MNGEALPAEHGFPVRMVVPGLYGYVSATKWLTELKVTTFAADEAYWTPRGYSGQDPHQASSRVDTPRVGKAIEAGTTQIAGVAWARPDRHRAGRGADRRQPLAAGGARRGRRRHDVGAVAPRGEATAGTHYVSVRAIDKAGNRPLEERAPIAPNGSTGLQRTLIRVG